MNLLKVKFYLKINLDSDENKFDLNYLEKISYRLEEKVYLILNLFFMF
jgi:hypothetical protein